jgi:hypothetical protein
MGSMRALMAFWSWYAIPKPLRDVLVTYLLLLESTPLVDPWLAVPKGVVTVLVVTLPVLALVVAVVATVLKAVKTRWRELGSWL